MRVNYSDLGIVLKTQDYKEADKIFAILTKNHGLIHYFAVGTRRSGSKKSPHLDLLSLVKFSVTKIDHGSFLNQAESLNHFSEIKNDLKKISLTVSFAEILYHLIPEEVEDQEVYESYLNYLNAVNLSHDADVDLKYSQKFGSYLLRHLGYPPPAKNSDINLSSYFEILMNRKIISKEIS